MGAGKHGVAAARVRVKVNAATRSTEQARASRRSEANCGHAHRGAKGAIVRRRKQRCSRSKWKARRVVVRKVALVGEGAA